MIKVAFFDVGETLIHDGNPFPGVADALEVIANLQTADGPTLVLGIVSDYFMPDPPRTDQKIAALEQRYRDEVLGPSGLSGIFQPFESRVTLSSRAGVFKPDRRIFDAALARSGTGAALDECIFVTENLTHLDKCAEFGMTPVQFGPRAEVGGMAGFEDWVDAPAVVARLIDSGHPGNRAAAVTPALAARHGLVGFVPVEGGVRGDSIRGHAGRLVQLNDARLGALDGVYVELPTEVTVELGPDGRAIGVSAAPPGMGEVADAANFVSSLVKSRKVAIPGQVAPAFGATHTVETDPAGRPRLVRRGYSAC